MKILLTGATGFIGQVLVPTLLEQGHEVYAWVRNADKAASLFAGRVKCVEHMHMLQGQDFNAVINLAGEGIADKRWTADRKAVLRSSRIDLTRQLADFINSLESKPAVVLSGSAIGYYGSQPADVELDETSAAIAGFTHSLCADWEEAALAMAGAGTRVCLLRTGVVLGKGGGALAKMLLPFRLGLGGPVGNGQQVMSWIHMYDWIHAVLLLLSTESLSGPFNLVSPYPVSNEMFSRELARAVHRPAVFRLPCFALRMLMGEAAELLCEGQRVIPAKLLAAGYQFSFSHIDKALTDIVTN